MTRKLVKRRRSVAGCVFAASLLLCSPTQADERNALNDRSLAAGCAACHGTDGRPLPESAVPGIAGLRREDLRDTMQAFKHGTRGGTVMPQIAKGYDDAQIERLAAYFASRPARAAP